MNMHIMSSHKIQCLNSTRFSCVGTLCQKEEKNAIFFLLFILDMFGTYFYPGRDHLSNGGLDSIIQ